MPRIPFHDVPRLPPYIRRSLAHQEFTRSIASLSSSPSLLVGDQSAMGVSRTLSSVSWEFDSSRFDDERSRHPVVVDFYPNAHLDLAENLVLIRNQVVRTLDRHFQLPNIEFQLYEFDALYHIWRHFMEYPEDRGVALHPSRFRQLSKQIAKRLFTVGTGGLFDALELFKDVTLVSVAAGGGLDIGTESLGGRLYSRIGRFLRIKVAPRVSGELSALVENWDDVDPKHLGNAMLEFLGAFLINVNRSLAKGYLLLIVDAIDEVEGPRINSLRLRAAFGKLIARCTCNRLPAILGGRAPASDWSVELSNLAPVFRSLGPIDVAVVRSALMSASVDRNLIERIMGALQEFEGGISGGEFAELWEREA